VRFTEDDYREFIFAIDHVLVADYINYLLARAFGEYRLNFGVELWGCEGLGDVGVDSGLEGP
jgi:hypothetical protein